MLSGFPPVRGTLPSSPRSGSWARSSWREAAARARHALADRLFAHGGAKAWLYGAAMHGDVPPDGAGSAIAATHLNVMGHARRLAEPRGRRRGAGRGARRATWSARRRVRTGAPVTRVQVERGRAPRRRGRRRGARRRADRRGRRHARTGCWGWPATRSTAATPGICAPTVPGRRRSRSTGRCGPDPVERRRGARGGDRARRRRERRGARGARPDRQRAARAPVHAARPAVHRRPEPGAGRQAHRMGLHARPAARPTGRPRRIATSSAWRRRSSASRPASATGSSPATCSGPAEPRGADANLAGGDVGAGSYALDQVVFRPVPRLSPYRTPVRGLYIGSAATFPGGAVHGVPGLRGGAGRAARAAPAPRLRPQEVSVPTLGRSRGCDGPPIPGTGSRVRSVDRDRQREEAAAFARLRAGEPGAREALVERYLPLVHHLARRYGRASEPLEDLVQVGSIGLLGAIDRYDPASGTAFSSFAVPTILGEIRRHFRDRTWSVRVPRSLKELAADARDAADAFERREGRIPTAAELAADLGTDVERLLEARYAAAAQFPDSLDRPMAASDGDGATLPTASARTTRCFTRPRAVCRWRCSRAASARATASCCACASRRTSPSATSPTASACRRCTCPGCCATPSARSPSGWRWPTWVARGHPRARAGRGAPAGSCKVLPEELDGRLARAAGATLALGAVCAQELARAREARRRSRSLPRWARAARAAGRAAHGRARARPCAGPRACRRAAPARRPAVLLDPPRRVGRRQVAGVAALGEPRDQRVRERRHRGGIGHRRLRVGDAQLERAVLQVRAQLPPPAAGTGSAPATSPQAARPRAPPSSRSRAGRPGAEQLADFGRTDARPVSRPRRRARWRRARRARVGVSAARCRRRACGRRRRPRRAPAARRRPARATAPYSRGDGACAARVERAARRRERVGARGGSSPSRSAARGELASRRREPARSRRPSPSAAARSRAARPAARA